jgi:hypothetical protein
MVTAVMRAVAADHARLLRLRQGRREGGYLAGLLALVAGDRTGQRIQQDVLGRIPRVQRQVVVCERRREAGQHLGDVF